MQDSIRSPRRMAIGNLREVKRCSQAADEKSLQPDHLLASERWALSLYDACLGTGKKNHEAIEAKRGHLIPILVAAFDTGMRLNELLTLTWPQSISRKA